MLHTLKRIITKLKVQRDANNWQILVKQVLNLP